MAKFDLEMLLIENGLDLQDVGAAPKVQPPHKKNLCHIIQYNIQSNNIAL